MRDMELSVAIPEEIDRQLKAHLLREDGQEDLAFALWSPSQGQKRFSALLSAVALPENGDRQVHGNTSFNPQYFERVCVAAAAQGCGVAFLHSHLGPGWQDMSADDIAAEKRLAGAAAAMTNQPLLGMTLGTDGTWSARLWERTAPKVYDHLWCRSVRTAGDRLRVSFANSLAPPPDLGEMFRRTATVWGREHHANLARMRIGIAGLGSVGSMVAEILARAGLSRFVLIDFDEVQSHNLDRLVIATPDDVGLLKVAVAARRMRLVATTEDIGVDEVPYSVVEEQGYRAALDCDVLFSCVDRPRARSILNHLAYAHLIPVVDGGIEVRFKHGRFAGVDWQLQTVAPGRPCLQCLGAFDASDASTDEAGKLDDPSYLAGLPADHRFKRSENVFAFSTNLASLEVLQFVALATGIANLPNIGVQRYRYIPGILETNVESRCGDDCMMKQLIGRGDRDFQLIGRDLTAEAARRRQGERAATG